jgi:16S rRNA (cytosine967-C5)-methyltransferase
VNSCRTTLDDVERALRESGRHAERGTAHPECLLVPDAGDPSELPGFGDGWFAIQDQASAFVVSVLDPQPGERVLDACAGPGGKTAHAACLVGEEGLVVAGDVRWRRATLVQRSSRRLGVAAAVLAADATRPAVAHAFDRVLVDAPCSGLGAARRRPELLWRARRSELSTLARLQVAILDASADLVRPGGRLVYAVCTYPLAETDAACDAIVRHRPDLVPERTPGPDGKMERHRLWPHRHGCDAMFVAAFHRLEETAG